VLAAALLPRIGGGSSVALRDSAEVLARELRYAGTRATATGRLHRWVVDLDEQQFRLERIEQNRVEVAFELPTTAELLDLSPPTPFPDFIPVDDHFGTWRWIDERGVWIAGVEVGDETYEEGVVAVAFGADGGADPALIRLLDEEAFETRLRVVAFTGAIKIVEIAPE